MGTQAKLVPELLLGDVLEDQPPIPYLIMPEAESTDMPAVHLKLDAQVASYDPYKVDEGAAEDREEGVEEDSPRMAFLVGLLRAHCLPYPSIVHRKKATPKKLELQASSCYAPGY